MPQYFLGATYVTWTARLLKHMNTLNRTSEEYKKFEHVHLWLHYKIEAERLAYVEDNYERYN